jgi:hypothetical protein
VSEIPRKQWAIAAAICVGIALLLLLIALISDPLRTLPIYGLFVLFQRVALPLALLFTLAGVILLVIWFVSPPTAPRPTVPAFVGLCVLIAGLITLGAAFAGSFAVVNPRDTANFDGAHYELAYFSPLDNDTRFILYQCGALGLDCRVRYESAYFGNVDGRDPSTYSAALVQAENVLAIVIDGQTITTLGD